MNEQCRSGYLERIARMMSREGWEICSMENNTDCLVYIFQSSKDHREDRVMCHSIGSSFDDAFTKCLAKIIEFYTRDYNRVNVELI